MKKKFFAAFLCMLILCSSFFTVVASAENSGSVNEAQSIIDGIFSFKLKEAGKTDFQSWINEDLAKEAGTKSEWYILSLSQYGNYDFSAYVSSLLQYLSGDSSASATTKQKYALCLIAAGSCDRYISEICNTTIGNQGITSLIFGLHLLNNGYTSKNITKSEILDRLLSLQLEDGGWSLNQSYGDVDVTAMVLQALAPCVSDESLTTSVDKAINFLSQKQNSDGGFSSYGLENPESAAQVIVALSALGIDCVSDSRFIKNGCTVFGALEQYALNDGSYCHQTDKGFSETATIQVLYSMISYLRMKENKSPFYVLDKRNPENVEPAADPEETKAEETTAASENSGETGKDSSGGIPVYKIIASCSVFAAAAILSVILYCAGKRNKKNFIFTFAVAAALILVVLFTDFESTESYYGKKVKKDNAIGTVTISIRCDNAVGVVDKSYVPEDGIILSPTVFEIEEGETVFDILTEATAYADIRLDFSSSGNLVYVRGIASLYEFDGGDLSGWMYRVNGVSPSVGCDEYPLQPGDVIQWDYTLNIGDDIK